MTNKKNFNRQRKLQGRLLSRDVEKLDEVLNKISSIGPIDKCKATCPMYRRDGICQTLGTEAPLGDDCLPQKFSKERSG
ncbi:MAG TPA: hypothetical protein VLE44_00360 [Candidatus Saccharimonadales bacterium]|nr:hypothetical protein [Candidatus Saccharimonadales bacterium]